MAVRVDGAEVVRVLLQTCRVFGEHRPPFEHAIPLSKSPAFDCGCALPCGQPVGCLSALRSGSRPWPVGAASGKALAAPLRPHPQKQQGWQVGGPLTRLGGLRRRLLQLFFF